MDYKFKKLHSFYFIDNQFSCEYNYLTKVASLCHLSNLYSDEIRNNFQSYFNTGNKYVDFKTKKELNYNLNQFNNYYNLNLNLKLDHLYTTYKELNYGMIVYYYPASKHWVVDKEKGPKAIYKTRKAAINARLNINS